MFLLRRVVGKSMVPALRHGQVVLAVKRRRVRRSDVVIFRYGQEEYIKRVRSIQGGRLFVQGDNGVFSTDSREFGLLDTGTEVAVVIWPRRVWQL